jgi:SAM-dependent methyltransferase
VDDYVRYRPGYPAEMLDFLAGRFPDAAGSACADVGSGTGILSAGLADRFRIVYGVEPNAAMRGAAERLLREKRNFVSVDGAAEATGLGSGSVACVAAAQAFHWFDADRFRDECKRVLASGGLAALIWNRRRTDAGFLERYDALLRKHAEGYAESCHRNVSQSQLDRFFGGGRMLETFENVQRFDFAGLCGRLDSSSYAPRPGTRAFDVLRLELAKAFEEFEESETVEFRYVTELHWGTLA